MKNPRIEAQPSIFFDIASQVDGETQKSGGEREEIKVTNSVYQGVLGREKTVKFLQRENVTVISTPEAEAISGAGGFVGKNGEFLIPRYHLGVPAQWDMEVAMYYLANTPAMKEIISKSRHDNSGVIYFAREGHLTEFQKAIYLMNGENLPTTIANISHKSAENEYTRESVISTKLNLEGFNKKNLEVLYICDPVASGMQHVAMLEELKRLDCLPKTVVIVAPMATGFGLRVIELASKEMGIDFRAGCCAAILDSSKPLRYYSPYPENRENVVDQDLHEFIRGYFGDKLGKSCIRCNWTGTFYGGPDMPMKASEEELNEVGLSNKELLDICARIGAKEIAELGLMDRLDPYSARMMRTLSF